MGSIGNGVSPVYDINKVSEDYIGLRKFIGTIYSEDLQDYGSRYGLPTGDVKMVKIGEWADGTGTYKFADGSHDNMQFIRRKKTFYLETVD